jgi:hypothetical protein
MSISTLAVSPQIVAVSTNDDMLRVTLADGRVVEVPIAWYPRLSHALPEHRASCQILGRGHGIHWPELDEDISVENLLFGQPSGEGRASFARWKAWYASKIGAAGVS